MDPSVLNEVVTNGGLFIARSWMRYLVTCGGAFLLFWVLLKDRLRHRRCQPEVPRFSVQLDELKTSLLGIIFFMLPTILAIPLYLAGYLSLELDPSAISPAMLALSFGLYVLGADTWFYWMHRAMHDSRVYRWAHALHHRFEQPSPLAGYSFAFLEGVLLGMFTPVVAVVFPLVLGIPLNAGVLAIFVIWFSLNEAYVHLGFEILPRGFASNPIGRWIGTSVFHNMHHEQPAYNFGVYFTWWDRMMGTIHPGYAQRFDEVTARPLLWRPEPGASEAR